MQPIVKVALEAARRAGKIIAQAIDRLDKITVSTKSENDYVTEVDKNAEYVLIEAIQKAHPDHAILAEESGQIGESDTVWIIDPLDGTTNFIHGLAHVAVSIGIQIDGVMQHGLIYDPLRDEVFSASRGRGAFLNGHRVRISAKKHLTETLLATGFPFRNRDFLETYLKGFKNVYEKAGDIRRFGSAALDLAYVAAGRLDGYWEYNLKPWDVAAGSLLVREAGGVVTDTQGGENYLTSGNIVAGNIDITKALLRQIS